MEKELMYFLNGEWVPKSRALVPITDFSVAFGYSVFEGIRIYDGAIFRLIEHLVRLENSARMMGLKIPHARGEIVELCKKFVVMNEIKDGHFIIRVTPGAGYGIEVETGPLFAIYGQPMKASMLGDGGIKVAIATVRDIPPECFEPRIKCSGAYVNHKYARNAAVQAGYNDAVLLDTNGFVAELSGANIFIAKDGVIKTSKKQFVLEGITRSTMFEIARQAGIPVQEDDLTPYDLYTADEVFACGSGYGVIPITQVDTKLIGDGAPGQIWQRLSKLYERVTHTEGPWLTRALPATSQIKT